MRTTIALVAALFAAPASALTINDLDLTAQSFDSAPDASTAFIRGGLSLFTAATGVSNGIGFSLTAAGIRADMSGPQTFNDMPAGNSFNDLHVAFDWTVTFDQAISSLLIAVANDNTPPSDVGVDLGLLATDSLDMLLGGTEYQIVDGGGGLLYYEFSTPITTLTATSGTVNWPNEAYDLAFFANPAPAPIPLPASSLALLSGLGILAFGARRKNG